MRTAIAISFIMLLTGMAILLLTGMAQPTRAPTPITTVSVRDADFQVVKVLTPAELAAFQQHWQNKQKVETPFSEVGGQHFKLDINCQDSDVRWLYHTTGYVQVLSKRAKPVFKLQDPEAFNKLVGAAK